MMSKKVVVTILMTNVICTVTSLGFANPPTIIEVSTNLTTFVAPTGSMKGGTILYIKGTNFSPNPEDNTIAVGNYPCNIIADGTQQDRLTCMTTPATNPNQLTGLAVRITVGSAFIACDSNNCAFSYTLNRTPFVQEIVPRSAVAGGRVYVFGTHRITNLGDGRSTSGTDIKNLVIGDRQCTTTDIIQNEDTFDPALRSPIECRVDPTQPAGQYDFRESLTPGFANKSIRTSQTSLFTGKNYTQRVIAQLTSLSAHQGGSKGQVLTIKGNGFTTDTSDYTCTIAGQTCTVTQASLTELTVKVPPISSGNTQFGKLGQEAGDSSIQTGPFIGSNGIKYRRYDRQNMWFSTSNWLNYLRGSPANRLISQKILTELSSPEGDGIDYVEYAKGYFYAPLDGVYRFSVVADDDFLMMMSTVKNNANISNLVPLLMQQAYNDHHYVSFVRSNLTKNCANVTLVAGYYYFQLINHNWGGNGYFKVYVDMPSLRQQKINPTWQIDRIVIKPSEYEAQVIKVRVFAASGSFDLFYYDSANKLYLANIPVGASAYTFRTTLYNLPNINSYFPSCTRTTLDASGNPTSVAASIQGYEYTITIDNYRPATALPSTRSSSLVAGSVPVSLTITRISAHSPFLSGSFSLLINNVPLLLETGSPDIPYNGDLRKLENSLNALYQSKQIQVSRVLYTQPMDSIELIIEYVGVFSSASPITIDSTKLAGGKAGAGLYKSVEVLRQYSNRELYSPVPYEFLYVASQTPTLRISVNSLPALCSDCSYSFNSTATPIVNIATRTGSTIIIGLTNPSSLQFNLQDIIVTFLGIPCTSLIGSISNFLCSLPTNADNSAALPAGTDVPIIHIGSIGYADNSGISPSTVPLTINSFTPNSSSPGGAIQAVMLGSGFPIDSSLELTIRVCGNAVTKFTMVSNQQLRFIIPPLNSTCSGSNNIISYHSQQASFTFAYNSANGPQVTSLSKASSSPILKSVLTVTGTNFGTQSSTHLHLVQNGEKKYQLRIASITSSTIECILGGGRSGIYDVVVQDSSNGSSSSSPHINTKFSYKIAITNLSMDSGHQGGGYNLTITGYNFATASGSNKVSIGNLKNSVCLVLSSSPTQIVCKMPRKLDEYLLDVPLDVVVAGRNLQESVCEGNCTFKYVDEGTSIITLPAEKAYRAGDVVTVTGTGLANATVYINNVECVVVYVDDTLLNFTYPALPAGVYEVIIEVENGWAYPQFMSATNLSFDAVPINFASYEGMELEILGNGLPSASYISAWFICSNTTSPLKVLSSTPTSVFILIPKFSGQASCRVNVSTQQTYYLFTYNYRNTKTCSISISGSNNSYTLTKNNMTDLYTANKAEFIWQGSAHKPTSSKYSMQISNNTITTPYLPAGTYGVQVHSSTHGFAVVGPDTVTVPFPAQPNATAITSSFAGGKELTIDGAGFVTNDPANNEITVCGLPATVVKATTSYIIIAVPALVTATTQSLYSISSIAQVLGIQFGDSANSTNIGDNSLSTVYSSNNAVCYVGINFGDGSVVDVSEVKFVPNPNWVISATKLEGGVVQGSNDGVNYIQIFTMDTTVVHSGWNSWKKTSGSHQYQYVRFRHTTVSGCQLAELKVMGIKYSTLVVNNGVDKVCDVVIKTANITLANMVTYSHTATSAVTAISPRFGSSAGGDVIYVNGTNFGSAVSVIIDGVNCPIVNHTATDIYCTTGPRPTPPAAGNTFIVNSDGSFVNIFATPFQYVDRWSNIETWGGQAIPREGDSVHVPKGMTLLVDQSTPILDSVVVEGKIQFEDRDITFDTHYFVINAGQFEAGTQANRFQHKLIITLHGGIDDEQLPTLGNKVLGCKNCKFNMHGKERTRTWTQVASTIIPGAVTFNVIAPVDWVAGEMIAVAATGFDHYQTEQKQISSVSANGLTITVTTPFKYRHYATTETFGTQNFIMRAEVGLLTRNIVVQGNEQSVDDEYGSHLMLTGKQETGLVAKISYSQFTKCGQPKIVGRYCTHFHMAGQVPSSYIRGISVHHSFARVLTIHGTHFLLFENNVGFHVKGHNIFIEDGIQTNNVIQDNLMMSSITSNTLLQSDVTVASYWITNPYNTVRRNHAAGGDFYGFWYELKEHPDGPSATSDICPMGMRLGISQDNVAHSNRRFGLRIFKLSARKYPCFDPQDQTALDPYLGNPPIQSVFTNYTLWKNEQCGFLGEQLGYTTIRNFKTIDSRKAGLQFHKTNFTKELVVAQNCLVVGFSAGNAPAGIDIEYANARGVIASRTDGLKFSGIKFFNFGPTMTPLQSCSECSNLKLWVTGGKTTLFENIHYTNIQGKYIFWQKWRRQIFIDLDGTMSRPFQSAITPVIPSQSKASIAPYWPSLMVPNHCYRVLNGLWNDSVYCDQTTTLRGILFTNPMPLTSFSVLNIKINLLANATQNVSLESQDQFSSEEMILIKKSQDIKNSWALPFPTGYYYNVHWNGSIDFTHMSIAPSRLWDSNDGVVLRFNYSDQLNIYQIGKWYQKQLKLPLIVQSSALISPASCQNADYYHDPSNKYLYVCVSGRNKKIREWIDIKAIKCTNNCPVMTQLDPSRQSFIRLWSNISQWPNHSLPAAGQNVTIPYEWNLVLDVDPPILKYAEINGVLIFDRTRDNTFQAHYIWVKQGIIRIGEQNSPFPKLANIILHGSKNDSYLSIDSEASGNKMLAVTGGIEFYGNQPQTVWTRLTQTAFINSTQITVNSAAGWKVGDKLVIAPSYSAAKQFQEVTITDVNATTLTFTPALIYQHYGAPTATVQNSYGVIDTRSAVGLLTRNIRISSGPDPNNWGCRVLIYGYNQISPNISVPTVWRNGYAKMKGVEIDRCSQNDTSSGAIRIQNIGSNTGSPNTVRTQIESSAIHGCIGFCAFLKQVSNVSINNNVFFFARKYLVYVEEIISQYNFTNNLLIGARRRDQLAGVVDGTIVGDDVAAYEQYMAINYSSTGLNVNVKLNLVQGSEGEGFVFPTIPCSLVDSYPFVNNTAGSCEIAFMYQTLENQSCLAARGCIGYSSKIGLMANMPGAHQRVQYSNMMFADNERAITLKYAHESDDNTIIFNNSYVTGISRPTCTTCYGPNKINYCAGGHAVRMFTSTITGQTFPLKKPATQFDAICTQEAFDSKAFIDGVTFENYLYSNPQLPYCSGMAVFKRHMGAADATASHYLTNTRCLNCEPKSWAYFDPPSTGWRGWFGGCGEIDCTGPSNYLIHDKDGLFTGEVSQILSNNSMIGDHESFCENISEINGHWCHTEELAVLEYESIAGDFNSRKIWPVYLQYDGGAWNSTTNAWKEWQWDGTEPMDLRLGRFWSVIKLHQLYNLTYSSQPPSDSRFQIQKRLLPTGNQTDWAIIRILYPLPSSIEVLVKNTTGQNILVKPFPIRQQLPVNLTTKSYVCGANNFYYQDGIIEFVVNGKANCQVRVRLSSYLQIQIKIDLPISDFYANDGITTFTINICQYLGIATDRLKIVGVRQGSTIVTAVIQSVPNNLTDSGTTSTNPSAEYIELNGLSNKLESGLSNGNISVGGSLLSFSVTPHVFNSNGTDYYPPAPEQNQQSEEEKPIQKSVATIIILGVVIPVIVIITFVAVYCCWRRKSTKLSESNMANNEQKPNRQHIKEFTEFQVNSIEDSATTPNKRWGETATVMPL